MMTPQLKEKLNALNKKLISASDRGEADRAINDLLDSWFLTKLKKLEMNTCNQKIARDAV